MADAPTERRPRTPLPPKDDPGRPAGGGGPSRMPGGRFWLIVFVLLAINYLSVALFAPGKQESVRIPYSPTFLQQVRSDNVAKISATGETVSGEFRKPITYPPSGDNATKAKNFDTEI